MLLIDPQYAFLSLDVSLDKGAKLGFAFKIVFCSCYSLFFCNRFVFIFEAVHEFKYAICEWPEGFISSFVNRRCINWDNAIYPVWVTTCKSHGGPATHRMPHNGKFVKPLCVCESHDIVSHHFIVVIIMVVWSRMISHLDQETSASFSYHLVRAKRPKIQLAAKKSMHNYHGFVRVALDIDIA